MDVFDRQPTNEEVEFAKLNGIQAAVDRVRRGKVGIAMQEAVAFTNEMKTKCKQHGVKGKSKCKLDDDKSEDGLD